MSSDLSRASGRELRNWDRSPCRGERGGRGGGEGRGGEGGEGGGGERGEEREERGGRRERREEGGKGRKGGKGKKMGEKRRGGHGKEKDMGWRYTREKSGGSVCETCKGVAGCINSKLDIETTHSPKSKAPMLCG